MSLTIIKSEARLTDTTSQITLEASVDSSGEVLDSGDNPPFLGDGM